MKSKKRKKILDAEPSFKEGHKVRTYYHAKLCRTCGAVLSIYNPEKECHSHIMARMTEGKSAYRKR
jgi:hypothetical protein